MKKNKTKNQIETIDANGKMEKKITIILLESSIKTEITNLTTLELLGLLEMQKHIILKENTNN